MCVAIWTLEQDHPVYTFLLVHNRDELYSRKTYPVQWWEDASTILAGRDGKEGGTWLGLSSNARLAFVTNVREPINKSDVSPKDHVESLRSQAGDYNGFNLVVADLLTKNIACYSHSLVSGDSLTDNIPCGVHGVSNGSFEASWPKVEKGKQKLKELLCRYPNEEIPEEVIVAELLQDKTVYDDSVLPKTGVTLERERQLSPLFVSIDSPEDHYGTMCLTVIAVRRNGLVSVYEKYASYGSWKDHRLLFKLPCQK